VNVIRIADGLWYWTAQHPNWRNWPDHQDIPSEVGCVYYEAPDAVCLIDPLLPAGEVEEFLAHLDGDVERLGLPVKILLTSAWHRRSADELAERYGAEISPSALPGGIEEIPIRGAPERQVAYFIRPHRALVVAEIFAVYRSGDLRVCPSPALENREELDASLAEIMELPVECLLVSHGEPVLADAKTRMAEAVGQTSADSN
jgi:hypothetical protein